MAMQPAQAGSSIYVHQKMMLELSTSGTAVCAATFCTNPIDVVKVRVQLASAGVDAPSGLTGTCSSIIRSEGGRRLPNIFNATPRHMFVDSFVIFGASPSSWYHLPLSPLSKGGQHCVRLIGHSKTSSYAASHVG